MTELYIVRHGTSDEDCDAKKTGEYLKRVINGNVSIVSSPSPIAKATAYAIARGMDYKSPIEIEPDIDEVNSEISTQACQYLQQEGTKIFHTFQQKYNKDPVGYYKNLIGLEKRLDESLKKVGATDMTTTMKKLERFANVILQRPHPVIVISHKGTIGALTNNFLGLPFMYNERPIGLGRDPDGPCSMSLWTLKKDVYRLTMPTNRQHL